MTDTDPISQAVEQMLSNVDGSMESLMLPVHSLGLHKALNALFDEGVRASHAGDRERADACVRAFDRIKEHTRPRE